MNQYNASPTAMGQTPPEALVVAEKRATPRTHAISGGM
jgi:hypothetical protein